MQSILSVYCWLFILITSLTAHDLDTIEIHKDDLHIALRRIDLENLSEQDEKTLQELSGDYEGVKNMFGKMIGSVFKVVHWIFPSEVLDLYKEAYRQKKTKMAEGQVIDYHYLIENLANNHQFMGNISITTYVDNRPDAYKDKLLIEFGLLGHPNYRGQGILSKLARTSVQTLAKYAPFSQGEFCFSTRSDNIAIHKIAQKLGAELVDSTSKEMDFILFKHNLPTDFFIIPREKSGSSEN